MRILCPCGICEKCCQRDLMRRRRAAAYVRRGPDWNTGRCHRTQMQIRADRIIELETAFDRLTVRIKATRVLLNAARARARELAKTGARKK